MAACCCSLLRLRALLHATRGELLWDPTLHLHARHLSKGCHLPGPKTPELASHAWTDTWRPPAESTHGVPQSPCCVRPEAARLPRLSRDVSSHTTLPNPRTVVIDTYVRRRIDMTRSFGSATASSDVGVHLTTH